MADQTKRQCNCCKGMPDIVGCDCPHSNAALKEATIEYLSHRGERPHRVLRGGYELWETHLKAMKSALAAYSAALQEAAR